LEEGEEAVAKLGLLHGIPFSVQDKIELRSKQTSVGCSHLAAMSHRDREDAALLTMAMQEGAIPLVKGN